MGTDTKLQLKNINSKNFIPCLSAHTIRIFIRIPPPCTQGRGNLHGLHAPVGGIEFCNMCVAD